MTQASTLEKMGPIDRNSKVYIAGHRGLVGSALWRHFESEGLNNLIGRTSSELDLRDTGAVQAFFREQRPDLVIDAAAMVGGIMANSTYPADFLSNNLRIQVNLIDAAQQTGVPNFLFLGSSCIYPRNAAQPIREDSLMTGMLEPTNDAYAIAKIAGILHVQAVRRQHGLHYISAMPTNLYGSGDNFHPVNSHVMPALIRRFHEAKVAGAEAVVCWGSGTPQREFLHVDDMAAASLFLLENYDDSRIINLGSGLDHTIAEISQMVADAVGYTGRIEWDTSKPDGMPRKLLDVRRLTSVGWKPRIQLADGIRATYEWFLDHQHDCRR